MKEEEEEEEEEEEIYTHISVTRIIQVRSSVLKLSRARVSVFYFSTKRWREGVQIEFGPHKKKRKSSNAPSFCIHVWTPTTHIERAPNINISKNMTSEDKITHPVELFVYDLR
jgi:hypothetical protein